LLSRIYAGLNIFCPVFNKNSYFATHFGLKTPNFPQNPKTHIMDFKQIQELIKIINKSNIGELSIEEKDFKITIRQKEDNVQTVYATAPQQPVYAPAPQMMQQSAAPQSAGSDNAGASAPAKEDNLLTIKSPMIGTFYRRTSPDKPALVEVGEEVSSGKVVCIIEAMKLFNEIESEVSGKIVKILVDDASPVEYDQPLFLVQPN
jgi:acetyl-CoA carboxylase biotin carboxyl carrier protein